MRGRLIASLLALLLSLPLAAQGLDVIDEISLDTRMTFHQQTVQGEYKSHFQGDYFNLHIKGSIGENVSFRIRPALPVIYICWPFFMLLICR